MSAPLAIIRQSYKKVGPTSRSDSSIAMTKKIQDRVSPRLDSSGDVARPVVLYGLQSPYTRAPNLGTSGQRNKFAGIFPRMSLFQ